MTLARSWGAPGTYRPRPKPLKDQHGVYQLRRPKVAGRGQSLAPDTVYQAVCWTCGKQLYYHWYLVFLDSQKCSLALLLSGWHSLSLEGEIQDMTKEERELQQNIIRVGIDLGVLLDIGLYPGKHALGLEECKGFVKSIVEDAQAKLSALTPPPPHPPPPAPELIPPKPAAA